MDAASEVWQTEPRLAAETVQEVFGEVSQEVAVCTNCPLCCGSGRVQGGAQKRSGRLPLADQRGAQRRIGLPPDMVTRLSAAPGSVSLPSDRHSTKVTADVQDSTPDIVR